MEQFLKKMGWTSILTSFAFTIMGIIIAYYPNATFQIISYVMGGIVIAWGIIKVIEYLKMKDTYDLYNDELAFGVIAILLGIVMIVCNNMIETLLRILIGLWIVYSGVMRFTLAWKLQKMEIDNKIWGSILVIAIIMLLCGIYIIASPGAIMTTIGIIMILYGVMDIIEEIIFMKNVKNIM